MCGIFCSISRTEYIKPSDELQRRLHQRGPDSQHTICRTQGRLHITLLATVLSLRGSETVTQPLGGDDGDYVFCWNGEAWSIDGEPQDGNDTEAVFELLQSAVDSADPNQVDGSADWSVEAVAVALSRLAGPYAFIFYDASRDRLYLGRDFLGRRSIMVRTADNGEGLLICSVSDGSDAVAWTELDARGVYCIDLRNPNRHNGSDWTHSVKMGPFNTSLIPYRFADDYDSESRLLKSVIPRLSLNKALSNTPEPLTTGSRAISRLESLLRASLSLRVLNIPDPPCPPEGPNQSFPIARQAILFSGGLDCTVVARIAHDLLPIDEPIDLLNVAFENPRIHKPGTSAECNSNASFELCPDRITGRTTYAELLAICPERQWRFVAINIPYTESQHHRSTVISLMSPHNTEMDLSISLALYFAARGQGQVESVPPPTSPAPYTTTARVLLSGLGADELFGGYTRHATAHQRGGMAALLDELELDVARLGTRNLGRDDRVMSHWSREVRFPYLDEQVVGWALAAPVGEKCGFGEVAVEEEGAIEPGKKALRCLAWKLGMEGVAREKKRAIQFGARTAKMETRKTKGTTVLSP